MLGAAIVGGGVQLSDIDVSIPFNQSYPVGGQHFPRLICPKPVRNPARRYEPLIIDHPYGTQQFSVRRHQRHCDQSDCCVACVEPRIPYLHRHQLRGAKLPYYVPGSAGSQGALNYVTLGGGTAVTAPLAGAFSLDDKLFFVSTAGDNITHPLRTIQPPCRTRSRSIPTCPPAHRDPILTASSQLRRPTLCRRLRLPSSRVRPPSANPTASSRAGSVPAFFLRSSSRLKPPARDENQPLQHDRIKA